MDWKTVSKHHHSFLLAICIPLLFISATVSLLASYFPNPEIYSGNKNTENLYGEDSLPRLLVVSLLARSCFQSCSPCFLKTPSFSSFLPLVVFKEPSGSTKQRGRHMEGIWSMFCGESNCSDTGRRECINHAFTVCFDILLLAMFVSIKIQKGLSKSTCIRPRVRGYSLLQIISAVFNGCLGSAYLSLGIWILEEKLRKTHSVLPLHRWTLLLFHGFTWLILALSQSLQGKHLPKVQFQVLSIFSFLLAGTICVLSLFPTIANKEFSLETTLDFLSFPGASLLLVCVFKDNNGNEEHDNGSGLYTPLKEETAGNNEADSSNIVTPFATAGFFSKMFFWWLNPLMRKATVNILEEQDIPKLREEDQAKNCYLQFSEQLNKCETLSHASILRAIIACHWKEIFVSGFFALLKTLAQFIGPLIIRSFIEVAEEEKDFTFEGCVLALALFFGKIIESLSERQWHFQSRITGMRVSSSVTAAIYKKQLRLSNSAKMVHSPGEIKNYVMVDAYRIGEFPFWFHQTWTTSLQLCLALVILFQTVGFAAVATTVVIVLTVLGNVPLVKLQHNLQAKFMAAQTQRVKASYEALVNMRVLKLYAWETHFKNAIEALRNVELKRLSRVQLLRAYYLTLFWASPILVSGATFTACYYLGVPLSASNVFTFIATLRLVQDPIRCIPDVIGVVIQAKIAFSRIVNFLEAPELHSGNVQKKHSMVNADHSILISSANFSWDECLSEPTLRNINLEVRPGEKVAICGEVGSGKSTLLAAILGELPNTKGSIKVHGKIAYVSQTAWIQTGTIQENILFGSAMDAPRYHEALEKSSLTKDLEMFPQGELTEIGERGVNLSGGQKQRVQLARALYQDANIYILDDPFSAVDAHTATKLLNEYVMGALSGKTVLLVTHQVDFLPAFGSVLLMSDGKILHTAPYHQLLTSSQEFQDFVNAHKHTAGSERLAEVALLLRSESSTGEIKRTQIQGNNNLSGHDQLIKQEEREKGNTGFKPYMLYLNQNKQFWVFPIAVLCNIVFAVGLISQNAWMAANVENPNLSTPQLIVVYLLIGCTSIVFLLGKTLLMISLGIQSSKSLFVKLLNSLFWAPMSFYDSTPQGRLISRVSSDLNIIDLDLLFDLIYTVSSSINVCASLGVLAAVNWQVLLVSITTVYLAMRLQKYYQTSAKELMRINGTTKSVIASHLAESIAGAMVIRAFEEEDRFFAKILHLIDTNASPFFYGFAARDWLIQWLVTLSATIFSSSALCMVLLPNGTSSAGFIGMALSYGLSLNMSLMYCIQNTCTIENHIICVERLNQYMHIPSEAPQVIHNNRPPPNWPDVGKVKIQKLQIRYRPNLPLVLRGINCTFEGGHKIGIVGRTGSGKTTLISALFRLVEPAGGRIIVDGLDISMIGLHDLRSRFGIIPQDPILFNGTIRYNLDPLCQHTEQEIWEVLAKCQLQETIREKEEGLDSMVVEDGLNWSMGQRQLVCLGRALLRRSRIMVLDEATASIDNATDLILQKTIKTECADCTVITVAHRIPTVMDCTMVLGISDGELIEYDKPADLMKKEGSLFGQLVREYWSHSHSADLY